VIMWTSYIRRKAGTSGGILWFEPYERPLLHIHSRLFFRELAYTCWSLLPFTCCRSSENGRSMTKFCHKVNHHTDSYSNYANVLNVTFKDIHCTISARPSLPSKTRIVLHQSVFKDTLYFVGISVLSLKTYTDCISKLWLLTNRKEWKVYSEFRNKRD
jgi:hypothetical protein